MMNRLLLLVMAVLALAGTASASSWWDNYAPNNKKVRLTYVMRVVQVDDTEYINDTLFRGPNYNPDRPIVSKRVMLTLQQLSQELDLSYNDLKAHGLRGNLQSKMAVSDEHVKSLIASVFCNGYGTSIDVSSFKKRKPSEVQ